jgi:hypothetical protein
LRTLARAGWRNRKGRLRIFRSVPRGLEVARRAGFDAERRAGNDDAREREGADSFLTPPVESCRPGREGVS